MPLYRDDEVLVPRVRDVRAGFLRRARDGDDARMCDAGAEGIVENHRDVLAFFVIVMRFS